MSTQEPFAVNVQEFGDFDTATLYEAQGKEGAMDPAIAPVRPGMRVLGRAYTVQCHPGDNLALHRAVALAPAGSVLVVDAGGFSGAGHWGEVLTVAAQARGIVGLVIDGGIRDVDAIARRTFPVFARGISVRATTKEQPGRVNVPIVCGGARVCPGDVVVGDGDGVVVIPAERAPQVLAAARARAKAEAHLMEDLMKGATTLELLGLEEILKGKGIA